MSTLRTVSLAVMGLFFIAAGVNHFLNPQVYVSMMPPYLPYPETLNYISGAAEVAGGIGIWIPRLRWLAAWGLIALLVAVFPANVQMAMDGLPGHDIPTWVLLGRLPLQLVFIAWVYWTCLAKRARGATKRSF
ncbi:putative membrane protein [Prosthecobacter fusiformis]|uniref:Putative membrane protein n=1 Tax=Prosthecobacter fusiformis TaxID=48464 RepID=A0A4R7RL59_9BACT|nr:DoxX family protein [Prosthecobacter fusiformis]TDU66070.1 putative membrane protein [Prosthecobacter fusiformis]